MFLIEMIANIGKDAGYLIGFDGEDQDIRELGDFGI